MKKVNLGPDGSYRVDLPPGRYIFDHRGAPIECDAGDLIASLRNDDDFEIIPNA